ncbi:MAG TPA: LytTR family DNA-binding domain-containing protein [Gemmatimonadaceae bacterium]|nr:LytTR family DNA-binding domain-containing protein [Gemmatimonadaceae bacterium]
MGEIRALIVDDEPLARRGLRQLAAEHPDLAIVGEAGDGREALDALDALAPDLVFLDVQMPELDGFGVVRARGAARMPAVVFVTAFDTFAVRAFEAHALDYLVKPVTAARFAAALDRVRERMRSAEALELSRRLHALLLAQPGAAADARPAPAPVPAAAPAPVRRLVLPTATGELLLDVDEIDWIEADDYYAAVHAGRRRHLIRESLGSLEGRLDPARFTRVHRSAIVNLDRVRELRTAENGAGHATLVLRDGTRVPVSRRRREQVAELLRRPAG